VRYIHDPCGLRKPQLLVCRGIGCIEEDVPISAANFCLANQLDFHLMLSGGAVCWLTLSHSVYPANENQACFLLVVLDSRMGPALQLLQLLFPSSLVSEEICPVFPCRWRRLVFSFFWRARQSCESRDS